MMDSMTTEHKMTVQAEQLGSAEFRQSYGVKYAYVSGAMYKGIASRELVVAMARAGLMSFFGSGGLTVEELGLAIKGIQSDLTALQNFGMNLLADYDFPEKEMLRVELFLKHGIRFIEASAYMSITPALVRYRLTGIHLNAKQQLVVPNNLMAKISRPEVAAMFAKPAPREIVELLLHEGKITELEASLSNRLPLAQDMCVESDSAGHTDQGNPYVLFPAIANICKTFTKEYAYQQPIRCGAAGGIGTPEAAMATFMLGADFIVTGSVNQCTVEARTSDLAKDLLQEINVQDTAYAPAGDMFELGAKVQVLKRGVFFPLRANKLYQAYQQYGSLEELPQILKIQIEEKFFKCSLDDVWQEVRRYYLENKPDLLTTIEQHPKRKMAAVFRWYFGHSTRQAMSGNAEHKVDFQIHCGPALGAFNQWVKGTQRENWRNRHVHQIAEMLMQGAASLLSQQLTALSHSASRKQSLEKLI